MDKTIILNTLNNNKKLDINNNTNNLALQFRVELMKQKKTITSAALLLLGIGGLHAQETITTTGSEATGTGGTTSYTVGQVVYTTNTGSNGNVAQGVQQPYEIFTVGIKKTVLDISLSAFPNPTTNHLTLQLSNYNNEKLTYQLYDMQGNLLNNGQIIAQQTKINMNNLPKATYFINIIDQENKKVQSFKIIKN